MRKSTIIHIRKSIILLGINTYQELSRIFSIAKYSVLSSFCTSSLIKRSIAECYTICTGRKASANKHQCNSSV